MARRRRGEPLRGRGAAGPAGDLLQPPDRGRRVVDDSASLDQEVFNMEAYEGADWVRVSDDVPVDEDGRDRLLETLPDPLPPRLRRLGLRDRARAGRRRARRGRGRPGPGPRGLSACSRRDRGARLHPARPERRRGRSSPSCAGETVVLYFYPRADTPGCTTQACGVRDRRADYAAAGARVIGISPDEVEAVDEVRRQVRPRLHPARRRRPRGRRDLRRLGREVDVRQEVHGRAARDLHHRPRGQDRQGLPQGLSRKQHDDVVLKALAELQAA